MALQLISFACTLANVPNGTAIASALGTPIVPGGEYFSSQDVTVLPIFDPSVASAGTGYFMSKGKHILGSYAAAAIWVTRTGTVVSDGYEYPLQQAQLFAPSLLRLGPASIEPLATKFGESDPNMSWLLDGPIALQQNELLQAFMTLQLAPLVVGTDTATVDATKSNLCVTVVLADEILTPPLGEVFWTRINMSASLRAFQWSGGDARFPGNIPAGRYALVGLTCVADTTGIAMRAIFPAQPSRPGVISVADRLSKTNEVFYSSKLGIYGIFEPFAPPSFEFLATKDANDVRMSVAMAVMKIS